MKDVTPVPPSKPSMDDDLVLAAKQSRLGLVLFAIYLAAYGGFMGLSAFAPDLMAKPAVAGVNLAIAYGLGLILAAVVLAVLYMVLAGRTASRHEREGQ